MKGWQDIIARALAEMTPEEQADIAQVKEQFGGLRIYFNGPTSFKACAAVDRAEEESLRTCEDCGQPGEGVVTRYGWLKTLCETCAAPRR